jgi:hypothetical protein
VTAAVIVLNGASSSGKSGITRRLEAMECARMIAAREKSSTSAELPVTESRQVALYIAGRWGGDGPASEQGGRDAR